MKAIVHIRYGSSDVLELHEVDNPTPKWSQFASTTATLRGEE